MTSSTERHVLEGGIGTRLGARWREERVKAQEAALPGGRVLVSCSAAFGVGGLGRHLREIVEALDRRGQPRRCVCGVARGSPAPAADRELRARGLSTPLGPLTRFSPSWRTWRTNVAFDTAAARRLPAAEHLVAFNGQALTQFRAAKKARVDSLALVAANSHMLRVQRQHALAFRQYPLERSWATHLIKRNLSEYREADRIYVASRHVRESFLQEGFAEEAIVTFPLTPDPRFCADPQREPSSTFDIVYVGSLSVVKGVPLLIDAVRALPHGDLRLLLVGGWGTPGVRRFIERACAADPRVTVARGDPLSYLRAARLSVHPSYEDGFGYAPAEALACGVPAIVSENTGMKELVDPGQTGLILPTGDLGRLTEAIDAVYRGEVLGG